MIKRLVCIITQMTHKLTGKWETGSSATRETEIQPTAETPRS